MLALMCLAWALADSLVMAGRGDARGVVAD